MSPLLVAFLLVVGVAGCVLLALAVMPEIAQAFTDIVDWFETVWAWLKRRLLRQLDVPELPDYERIHRLEHEVGIVHTPEECAEFATCPDRKPKLLVPQRLRPLGDVDGTAYYQAFARAMMSPIIVPASEPYVEGQPQRPQVILLNAQGDVTSFDPRQPVDGFRTDGHLQ